MAKLPSKCLAFSWRSCPWGTGLGVILSFYLVYSLSGLSCLHTLAFRKGDGMGQESRTWLPGSLPGGGGVCSAIRFFCGSGFEFQE